MIKFLIQKIDGEVRHDFAFTLLESIRFKNWLNNTKDNKIKFLNTSADLKEIESFIPLFKPIHFKYVPIGSVEFVCAFLKHFYDLTPKPVNVPEELFYHPSFDFTKRRIFNGTEKDFKGKLFVKSNTKIKGVCGILNEKEPYELPVGEYQFSGVLTIIESEWRAFVYKGKLVGLQNYAGDFTKFPSVGIIKEMIETYKSAPIAYTLDIGVGRDVYDNENGMFQYSETFVIEAHDFFSCGLYGFADHAILPNMFYQWFWQYIQIQMVEQKRNVL
jgi:hypothetical protein